MNEKYELTDETVEYNGHILHRIRALKDFWYVKRGDLGGFIENEINLSQYGNAWVSGNAWVYDDAEVYENAFVCGNAKVYGSAWVYGNAKVSENAWVYDEAKVFCTAEVYENAKVCGKAKVSGFAQVYGNANVSGNAWVYDNAWVCDDVEVCGNAFVCGNAKVYGKARVGGDAEVCDNADICGGAIINTTFDYSVYKNSWSSGSYITYTSSNKMWKVGCFYGTGEELVKKAYADGEVSGRCYEAIVRALTDIDDMRKVER